MDNIRGSLSRMKKRFKRRPAGGKRKQDGTGASPGGEGTDSKSSLPQPEPHVTAGKSYEREGDRANVAGERSFSADRPQSEEPESLPVREGDDGKEGEKADVDGGEAGQTHSRPNPDVEAAVGSGRGEELEAVHPSPSTPSISRGGVPDGT